MLQLFLSHRHAVQFGVSYRQSVFLTVLMLFVPVLLSANPFVGDVKDYTPNTKNVNELEYRVVLFHNFQNDYFKALVEQSYLEQGQNPEAISVEGQLLKGGMSLSYGMSQRANKMMDLIFSKYKDKPLIQNQAYYYLAHYDYHTNNAKGAKQRLQSVKGDMPKHLALDYLYLSSLVNNTDSDFQGKLSKVGGKFDRDPRSRYLKFNNAINLYHEGSVDAALRILANLAKYGGPNEEFLLIRDRAKHAMALIAMEQGDFKKSWSYLEDIRTTGLYANRALLTYAWTAIKLNNFEAAITALVALSQRSIAIPEVQEAVVLLAHVYEQQGFERKALKAHLYAIKEFESGIGLLQGAKKSIKAVDVPRQFISNLQNILGRSDWFVEKPNVDNRMLNPFLIDLVSSHEFYQLLRELTDLYTIEHNLEYWISQLDELKIVLESTNQKSLTPQTRDFVKKALAFSAQVGEQNAELRLRAMSLPVKQQRQLDVLVGLNTEKLAAANALSERLMLLDSAYNHPNSYPNQMRRLKAKTQSTYKKTRRLITALEPIVRGLISAELTKHEERMTYYAAQSRLGRARLIDNALIQQTQDQQ